MLEQINQIAYSNPEYAIAIAFMFALVESLPIVGSFFPGMLTMPPIGWLIASGVIPGELTFSLILVGAMIGDYIGFYLGVFFRNTAHQKAIDYGKGHWLDAGEAFIEHYGPMSIIVGRFIGPFRSSIPLFAGIFRMNPLHFSLAAVPSVFLWAVVHLSPGVMIAWFNFDILAQSTMLAHTAMLTCLAVCVLALAYSNRLSEAPVLQPALLAASKALRQPTTQRPVLFRIGLLLIALILLACSIIHGGFDGINQTIYALVSSQHATIVQLSLIHNAFCYIPLVLLLTVFMTVVLVTQDKNRDALNLFTSVSVAFVICFVLKYLIHYPRPSHIAALLGNQSLPSGHSCLTTAFILANYFSSSEKPTGWHHWLGLSFIAFTMASRVFIGAHWVSDVLMGWMIGYLAHQLSFILVPMIPMHYLSPSIQSYTASFSETIVAKLTHVGILSTYASIALFYALLTNSLSISPYLI